jgi:hypothetical protein
LQNTHFYCIQTRLLSIQLIFLHKNALFLQNNHFYSGLWRMRFLGVRRALRCALRCARSFFSRCAAPCAALVHFFPDAPRRALRLVNFFAVRRAVRCAFQ